MSDLVSLEEFSDYASATARAKQLALAHEVETFVHRSESGWTLFAPDWVKFYIASEKREAAFKDPYPLPNEPETCHLCLGFGHSPTTGENCPRCLGAGVVE